MDDKVEAWLATILKDKLLKEEQIVFEPWSKVHRIATPEGLLYLKKTVPDLYIEAHIIQKYRDLFVTDELPHVVHKDDDLHCFLMRDAGKSLRAAFNGNIDIELMVKAIEVYRCFQEKTQSHLDDFVALGVPDWSGNRLIENYHDLLEDENFLLLEGLQADQINKLKEREFRVCDLLDELNHFDIKRCLSNTDFHDNNVLINSDHQLTLIDLGESVIDHPFFSLASFLKRTSDRYQINSHSNDYQQLRQACFNGWPLSNNDIDRAILITHQLLPLYGVLAHKRLIESTRLEGGLASVPRMHGRINHFCSSLLDY